MHSYCSIYSVTLAVAIFLPPNFYDSVAEAADELLDPEDFGTRYGSMEILKVNVVEQVILFANKSILS